MYGVWWSFVVRATTQTQKKKGLSFLLRACHQDISFDMSLILLFFSAISAAKDAAGNVDLQKVQQLREMGDALLDEASKKEN